MLLGLSTGHSVGLALVAGAFIVFAIASALIIPRRWPQYPGRGLRWFIVVTVVLFVATLAAVEVFAKESEEPEGAEPAETHPGTTTEKPPAPAPPQGDVEAGKANFSSAGCASCHTFTPAGANATVGPNLDVVLEGKDAAFVRESIVDPNKEIAKGYKPGLMPQNFGEQLSKKELDDLVAFLLAGSS